MFLCLCLSVYSYAYVSVYVYLYIAMHMPPLDPEDFWHWMQWGRGYSYFDPSGMSTRSWICVLLKIEGQYTLLTDEPSLQPPYLTYFCLRKFLTLHKLQRWLKHIRHCHVTNGYSVGLQSVSPWSDGDWKLFTRALDENMNRFFSRTDVGSSSSFCSMQD